MVGWCFVMAFFTLMCGLVMQGFTSTVEGQLTEGALGCYANQAETRRSKAGSLIYTWLAGRPAQGTSASWHSTQQRAGLAKHTGPLQRIAVLASSRVPTPILPRTVASCAAPMPCPALSCPVLSHRAQSLGGRL